MSSDFSWTVIFGDFRFSRSSLAREEIVSILLVAVVKASGQC